MFKFISAKRANKSYKKNSKYIDKKKAVNEVKNRKKLIRTSIRSIKKWIKEYIRHGSYEFHYMFPNESDSDVMRSVIEYFRNRGYCIYIPHDSVSRQEVCICWDRDTAINECMKKLNLWRYHVIVYDQESIVKFIDAFLKYITSPSYVIWENQMDAVSINEFDIDEELLKANLGIINDILALKSIEIGLTHKYVSIFSIDSFDDTIKYRFKEF